MGLLPREHLDYLLKNIDSIPKRKCEKCNKFVHLHKRICRFCGLCYSCNSIIPSRKDVSKAQCDRSHKNDCKYRFRMIVKALIN